jgi:MoxR-like ATPase
VSTDRFTEYLTQFATDRAQLLDQLRRVIVGQSEVVEQILAAIFTRGHCLLVGVPGLAKTLMVSSISQILSTQFKRIQFTPDLMPSDITGVSLLSGQGEFRFRQGPVFADLVLADEINRAPAKTQAALLEAMQERSVTVDGTSHALSRYFTVFATQNPIEFEGTYPLPEAELDRFLMKVMLDYPDADTEHQLLVRSVEGFEADEPDTYGVAPEVSPEALDALRAACRGVRVEDAVLAYVTRVVRATRDAPALTLGASPRASVALLRASQAAALLDGREYAVPDDVKALAAPVLRHRVVVAPELELEGISADQALRAMLDRVEVPR